VNVLDRLSQRPNEWNTRANATRTALLTPSYLVMHSFGKEKMIASREGIFKNLW